MARTSDPRRADGMRRRSSLLLRLRSQARTIPIPEIPLFTAAPAAPPRPRGRLHLQPHAASRIAQTHDAAPQKTRGPQPPGGGGPQPASLRAGPPQAATAYLETLPVAINPQPPKRKMHTSLCKPQALLPATNSGHAPASPPDCKISTSRHRLQPLAPLAPERSQHREFSATAPSASALRYAEASHSG